MFTIWSWIILFIQSHRVPINFIISIQDNSVDDLHRITCARQVHRRVDWLLARVHVIREGFIMVLLAEADFVGDWVVCNLNYISGCEWKRFKFTVELHLVAVPGVAIWTNEVVAMVGRGVTKIEVDFFHLIKKADAHPYPRSKLLDLNLPSFGRFSCWVS